MISRRRFVATTAGGLVVAPLTASAQSAAKVYRLGWLGTSPRSSVAPTETFFQGLRELGYVEGQNLVVEHRYVREEQLDRLPALAAELVQSKVDIIVATGSLTPFAAKSATTTIPVVATNVSDPVGSGLVVSLARPGGNITGLSLLSLELLGKQLELFKTTVPRILRMAVLWNPASQTHPRMLNEAEGSARTLGLRLERVSAGGLDDFDHAFSIMARARADAFLILGDPIFFARRSRIVELAAKHRLPGMFPQREYVDAGGLMSYGANLRENFRRAAIYVDKILKGTKPGDLPIEQPTKFELVVNAKTAKALGLTIPHSVLLRADQIIE